MISILPFANIDSRSVVAEFSAGPMTSGGGSLLLRKIDCATGLSSPMSRALSDRRDQARVHHGQKELLRQRLFKVHLKADRLSCTRFKANQFRLLLHTFAFVLLWHLRSTLAWTEPAVASVDTLKLKLLKIAARVTQSIRRILFTMPRAYPYQRLFATALQNIRLMPLGG